MRIDASPCVFPHWFSNSKYDLFLEHSMLQHFICLFKMFPWGQILGIPFTGYVIADALLRNLLFRKYHMTVLPCFH